VSYTVYELRDSESGSIDQSGLESAEVWSISKRYVIGQCPGGFYEAATAIAPYAPRYVRNPFGRVWRRKRLNLKGLGRAVFEVSADYDTLTPISGQDGAGDDNPDDNFVPGSLAWDTTGNTERRTQAKSERVIGDAGIDMQGAINASGTSVQGIDVVVPGMRYSETWIMPLAIGLSTSYAADVFRATGTLNKSKFRAFAPGECLFLGARAQWSGDQPYVPVTFEFQARPHDDNYELDGLPKTTKKGWEYVWIVYDQDVVAGRAVQKPKAYVFDTIYDESEFSALRITGRDPGRTLTGSTPAPAAVAVPAAGLFGDPMAFANLAP
jgi:hypothetical protein